MIPFEFQNDIFHHKITVPYLQCGTVCIILGLAVSENQPETDTHDDKNTCGKNFNFKILPSKQDSKQNKSPQFTSNIAVGMDLSEYHATCRSWTDCGDTISLLLCVVRCDLRVPECAKRMPHTAQTNGLSPVCTRM